MRVDQIGGHAYVMQDGEAIAVFFGTPTPEAARARAERFVAEEEAHPYQMTEAEASAALVALEAEAERDAANGVARDEARAKWRVEFQEALVRAREVKA